jgi:invasion protein IalB
MKIPSLAVLTLVCATLGAPALLAQTAASDLPIGREAGAPAEGEAQGEQPGQTYVAATHGAWEQRCVRTADGPDPCQLYQLLLDGKTTPWPRSACSPCPKAAAPPPGPPSSPRSRRC